MRARVGHLLHPGLEIHSLFDQRRRDLRIRCCLGEFEKDACLTLYILPADHFFIPGCQPAWICRRPRNRSGAALQSEHYFLFHRRCRFFWQGARRNWNPARPWRPETIASARPGKRLQPGRTGPLSLVKAPGRPDAISATARLVGRSNIACASATKSPAVTPGDR